MQFIDQVSYWKWAHSDLLCNRERGVLAEYIVAQAIGHKDSQGHRTVNPSTLRPSDIYVFYLLATQDRNILNPLDLSQWDFYVLPTSTLNQQCQKQQTIGLSSLLELEPTYAKYGQLNSVICGFNINQRASDVY